MQKTLLAVVMISAVAFAQVPTRYSGKMLTAHITGDIRDFFQAVSAVSGTPINLDPSIKRNVTVHVTNIPWDMALAAVMRSSGLSSAFDGTVYRIGAADPRLGQDHVLMGTVTVEGTLTEFNLQNPRTLIQMNAPGPDGKVQPWRIEWESAADLEETGVRPNVLKTGDQVIITGNLIRPNTLRLIIVSRPSDEGRPGFSWGGQNVAAPMQPDSAMFISAFLN